MTAPLIAPFKTGLDLDRQPWQAPADSFQILNNIHVKHGFLEKRPGYSLLGTVDSGEPIMGLYQYVAADGNKIGFAFDKLYANIYNTTTHVFDQLDVAPAGPIFSSGDYDFVWATNWQSGGGTNRLYFTNGKEGTPNGAPTLNGLRYYDPSVSTTATTSFYPTLRTGVTLIGAELIFSLGQRLIVLNTREYNGAVSTHYPQRARWCAKQNPANWNDVTAGGGGYTDAATGDQIISARALQNQIIVFFTDSVWALVPTSDPNRAFKWQKINSFRACDGKMATIGYDRYVVALGVRGITATDGVETRRIDERISNFCNENIDIEEFKRVFCGRSYANKRWWTLYNSADTDDTDIDSALIYDEDSNAYSTYSIALNAIGYGNNAGYDYAWEDFTAAKLLDYAWDDFGEETWETYFVQSNDDLFVGGDISGNVYVLEITNDDGSTSIESSFETAAWNPFTEPGSKCLLNYVDIYVDTDPTTKATIEFYKNTDIVPYLSKSMDFLPDLNFIGAISAITKASPANVTVTNHGLSTGDIVYIYGVEGMTDINSGNTYDSFTITYVDENNFTLDGTDSSTFDAYTSGGGIYYKKFYQTKVWKRIYCGAIGFQHRLGFTSFGNDAPFRIHAFKPMFKPKGKRLIN